MYQVSLKIVCCERGNSFNEQMGKKSGKVEEKGVLVYLLSSKDIDYNVIS